MTPAKLKELKEIATIQPQTLADKFIWELATEVEKLQTELAELKPQTALARQYLNNANAEIERLAEENRRLKVQLDKVDDYSFVEVKK